jgi:hypothetical protein
MGRAAPDELYAVVSIDELHAVRNVGSTPLDLFCRQLSPKLRHLNVTNRGDSRRQLLFVVVSQLPILLTIPFRSRS